ncbi:MAG: sigma-70 family RNA polymerase sigma factor [Taibaiella sp.]|jgi:RNA polymerase sigma-70 factor (ECF subfamily)
MIEAIQQNDEKAFEKLYKLYKDKLYFWLLGKTHSEYLAQEILQQTFVKVWVNRHHLSPALAPDIQLFRTARSLMIDHLRKLTNERNLINNLTISDADNSLQQHHNFVDTQYEVSKIIEQLPQMGQKVYQLSREEGLTYNEIAQKLSISPKTVEYHISKALGLLRKALMVIAVFLFS